MINEAAGISLVSILKHGFLALFGGFAHATKAHRTGQSKGVLDFILLSFMSSFSGVMFALVALHLFGEGYITLAAAGCGGFLGVEGLTWISHKVHDLLKDKK